LAARIDWLFHRPAEELYDLEADEYETKNLADDPARAAVKARLAAQLDAWVTQQGDQGMETEIKAPTRQGAGRAEKKGPEVKAKAPAPAVKNAKKKEGKSPSQ
jgi:hypothetical protein